MSFEHVAMVWRCGPDDLHQRAVLMAVVDFDAAGRCFASVAAIAEAARVSPSTANRALAELAAGDDPWITNDTHGRKGMTWIRVPNIGKLEAAFAAVLAERAARRKAQQEVKAEIVDKSRVEAAAKAHPCQTDRPPLSDRQTPPVRVTGEVLNNEDYHLSFLRGVMADRDAVAYLEAATAQKRMDKFEFVAASRWMRNKFGLSVSDLKAIEAAYRQQKREAVRDAQGQRA